MVPETRFQKEKLPCKEFDGESVLLDPKTGNFFVLNSVCQVIWDELDGEKNLGQIARQVVVNFDVSEEEALRDLMDFVQELLDQELVRAV